MAERNYSIDILKFLCCVFVVFIHTEWRYHLEMLPLVRCAVPCFFIISGYLLFDGNTIKPERLTRGFNRIEGIALWSTLFYVFWKESAYYSQNGSLWIPSFDSLVNWILLNDNPFAFHLWYIFAYLYVLIIIMVINKFDKWKVLFWVSPLLLLTDLVFGTYSVVLWGWEPPYIYVRNFLFVGLPFFATGALIKKCTNGVVLSNKRWLFAGCIILFIITSYLERYGLTCLNKCATREHYCSTIFLAIFLFLFALSINNNKKSIFALLGEKDSLFIYVFHPFFITYCGLLFNKIHMGEFYSYFSPLFVLISSILFTWFLRAIRIIE